MDNLEIYNKGREVPKDAQKSFDNGSFSGTDINPMWRIKKLTELFGPAGIGWYTDDIRERCEQHGNVTMAIVDLNLYVKYNGEWSKPIFGTGGNILVSAKGRASDEGYKMAYTDALSIACKALGIGADIWYANDKTKYTQGEVPFEDEPPICAVCGKPLKGYKAKDGSWVSAREQEKYTVNNFGKTLCLDCLTFEINRQRQMAKISDQGNE